MTISPKVPTLVAGTIVCAFAIGWGMQTFVPLPGSQPAAAAPGPDATDDASTPDTPVFHGGPMVLAPMVQAPSTDPNPHSKLNPASVDLSDVAQAEFEVTGANENVVSRNGTDLLGAAETTETAQRELLDPEAAMAGCAITARAEPAPRAMVALSIDAPCLPNAPLVIHHTGLMFTATSNDTGHLDVTVPALRDHAVFIVSAADGFGTVVTADLPDVSDWTRVALQWRGDAQFQIHAREFGADYGMPGHVWADAPENTETGSFLVQLGDGTGAQARLAEVYSFPRSISLTGMVDLTVETEVTADTCGRSVSAEALELRGVGQLVGRGLDLAMPNCAAIGDFLVLNNLMDDLKIVTN